MNTSTDSISSTSPVAMASSTACVSGVRSTTATVASPSTEYRTVPWLTGVPGSPIASIAPVASASEDEPTTSNWTEFVSTVASSAPSCTDEPTAGEVVTVDSPAMTTTSLVETSPVSSTPSDSCQASTMSEVAEVYSASIVTSPSGSNPSAVRLVSS